MLFVTARYKEYEVEQDTPNCTMVIERRCGGVVGNTCFTFITPFLSVGPLVGIGTPPPPLLQVSVPPPPEPEREVHTWVRGWGRRNSDDWGKSLAL